MAQRHHFTKAERDQQVVDTLRGRTDYDNAARRTIGALSRIASAVDAHREQALRRAQQNRDMLDQQVIDRASAMQPHAFTSGPPSAGEAAAFPTPSAAASFLSIAAE